MPSGLFVFVSYNRLRFTPIKLQAAGMDGKRSLVCVVIMPSSEA